MIIKEKVAWGQIKMLLERDFCFRRSRWSGSPLYLILAEPVITFNPSGEQHELRFTLRKKITTDDIIHVSCVEFHEEFNGTTPGAVKVGT